MLILYTAFQKCVCEPRDSGWLPGDLMLLSETSLHVFDMKVFIMRKGWHGAKTGSVGISGYPNIWLGLRQSAEAYMEG
jgi:hypothetical protein